MKEDLDLFVSKDKQEQDIFIPAENMNGAMHGDRVIANLTEGKRKT